MDTTGIFESITYRSIDPVEVPAKMNWVSIVQYG
jgi:hypothetical protein